jgi:hypothetical protein
MDVVDAAESANEHRAEEELSVFIESRLAVVRNRIGRRKGLQLVKL